MKKITLSLGMLFIIIGFFYDFLLGNSIMAFGKRQIIFIIIGLLIIALGIFIKSEEKTTVWEYSQKRPLVILKQISNIFYRDIDVLVVFFFTFVGIIFFLGRWQGNLPVINLGPDAANVATYSAVNYHPQNFINDFIYGNKQNFSYYVSIYIPLLQMLSSILGGYGIAYLSLLIPIIILHGTGFYILGKAIYKNRFWAFLLAITSLLIVYTESSDYWGIYKDPQPRMLFGAIFPWVLFLAYQSISKPKLRFITIIVLGAMLYINPVSIPGVAFAIWLGFLIFKPQGIKTIRHFGDLLELGLLFTLTAIPFALIYLNSREVIPANTNYSEIIEYFKSSNMGMFSLQETALGFLKIMISSYLLPLAIISIFLTFGLTPKKQELYLLLLWILGLLLISLGLTWLGNTIANLTHTLPILLQMNRDLRFIVPILEIILFLPLAYFFTVDNKYGWLRTLKSVSFVVLGLVLLFLLTSRFYNITKDKLDVKMYSQKTISCLISGKIFCSQQQNQNLVDLLEFIRNKTQNDSTFITYPSIDIRKQIRYQGLRSIAFDIRDIDALRLSDPERAMVLRNEAIAWQSIESMQENYQKEKLFIQFAQEQNADYAIMPTPVNIEFIERVVYSNDSYSIIQVATP